MNSEVLLTCGLIFLARIGDVSLGTIRTLCIVQGRAAVAWVLGFFEVLIWVFAVSQVMTNLDSPIYAVAYALGFATGSFVGIKIEAYLAFGRQVVRVLTRKGREVADQLRAFGYIVTAFEGWGRDGLVNLLFIETRRKITPRLLARIAEADPDCYYLVDDIRLAAHPAAIHQRPTGWRSFLQRK